MPITAVAPIPVSEIVLKAGNLLLDDLHVRWGVPELIRWINEAMGAICTARPDAFAHIDSFACDAGTLQQLPNGSVTLLDVTRNLASDGVTPGRAIRITDRKSIDDADPDWHTRTPAVVLRHFMYDPRVPRAFYVYPPAVAGTKIEVKHVVLPADVTSEADNIPIGREYTGPLVNYIVARANMKDSEFSSASAAAAYTQAFQLSLGMKPAAA